MWEKGGGNVTNTRIVSENFKIEKGREKGNCIICAIETEQGFKSKDFIKDARFTNFDILNNINSNIICEYCACCMKNDDLRRKSFIASKEKIIYLQKNDIENYIFNLKEHIQSEFVACLTRSFKKHNAFRAKVNIDTERFYIREEDNEYLFDAKEMKSLYEKLNEFYLYFNKEEIATGNYNLMSIKEFGIKNFEIYDNIIKQHRKTIQLDLLLHILNSEKRNEAVKERIKMKRGK